MQIEGIWVENLGEIHNLLTIIYKTHTTKFLIVTTAKYVLNILLNFVGVWKIHGYLSKEPTFWVLKGISERYGQHACTYYVAGGL